MATHSSALAWRTSRTEEPGGLQSMGCKESDTTDRLKHSMVCSLRKRFHQTLPSDALAIALANFISHNRVVSLP